MGVIILENIKIYSNHGCLDEEARIGSDYLVDLGPLAGSHGGELTAIGETKKLLANKDFPQSLTLKYLRGEKEINLDSESQ